MQIKNSEVFALIDRIDAHFNANINNRYLRQAFAGISIDSKSWDLIESLTEKSSHYRLQGYHFDELYERILALARFIHVCRREVAPSLRSRLSGGPGSSAGASDKIIRDMAVNNFASNLNLLSDLLNALFHKVVELDTEAHRHGTPVFKQMQEVSELGRYLVEK